MHIMAAETGYFIEGMDTGIPVMQVKRGVGCVAFEADERLRGAGKVFQVDQGLEITFGLDALLGVFFNQFFGQPLDGEAAGAMTGFTINKGHAGFFS